MEKQLIEIITKRDGPRREDVEAKHHVKQNWGTIQKLADQLSNGAYSAKKTKKADPQPSGFIISYPCAGTVSDVEPEPYLRISNNNRVIIMDLNSGLQMHFLGQIMWQNGQRLFTLATKENGFSSPLDDDLRDRISALDKTLINKEFLEADFLQELKDLLNLN